MTQTSITIEQRRTHRLALKLPVRVEVRVGRTVSWSEDSRCSDLSSLGTALYLKRPVKRGRMVLLSLAMPDHLRKFDARETEYKVWGVVQRCIQSNEDDLHRQYSTGIAFIGKDAPVGYSEHPSRLYDIIPPRSAVGNFWQVVDEDARNDHRLSQIELRKESRFSVPEPLLIEIMDEGGEVIALEQSVTENVSVGGAVVFTQFYAEVGTFLRVISERHNIEIISVVRGRREGPDGLSRLHVEFIDQFFPLGGIG
jgi:hypothetical protein